MSRNDKIQTICPGCKAKLAVSAENAGKTLKCPKCRVSIAVPSPAQIQPPETALITLKPSLPDPSDDDNWIDDAGISAEDAFRTAVRKSLADGVVTAAEREELLALRRQYGLDSKVAKRIFDEEKAAAVVVQPHSISAVDTTKVGKFLQLAAKASDSGNHEEAFAYCNKALEEDPQNHHAWFIKAKSVGYFSTLANCRIEEMISGFFHAIEFAPEDKKHEIAQAGARHVAIVTSDWFDVARNHIQQFVQADNAWSQFLRHSQQAIDGFRFSLLILDDPEIAKKAIEVCCSNIRGISYNVEWWTLAHRITQEHETKLRTDMKDFEATIRRHQPLYRLPDVSKVESTCFVVTAVTGSEDHPTVLFLQMFRDTWLTQRLWGKHAIRTYSIIGPPLANGIRRVPLLKLVARLLVVVPAVEIATILMKYFPRRLSDG